MEGDLTTEQFESVLKFCDVIGIEDFAVAALMLKQCNWNLNLALGVEQPISQPFPTTTTEPNLIQTKPQVQQKSLQIPQANNLKDMKDEDQQFNYQDFSNFDDDDNNNEYEYGYEYYQQELDKQEDLRNKRKVFDLGFVSMPLLKTKSEVGNHLEDQLGMDQEISEGYSHHKIEYRANLLKNSGLLCQRILSSKAPQIRKCYDSLKKNENNRKFLSNLHKKYATKINFTFGTFLLNLARSYLDKKLLLVYIHKAQCEDNNSIKMLLTHRQISSFVNKHCICYGMYDNSDDYDILQKYAPMSTLPSFLLFKFNKAQLKEQLISQYSILKSGTDNLLEWLAYHTGVVLKKKIKVIQTFPNNVPGVSQSPSPVIIPAPIQSEESKIKRIEMSNIIFEQNLEYQEMARLHELKRNKSAMRKQSEEIFEQNLEKMKQKFRNEPAHETGITIQLKFRLPETGNSLMRTFRLDSKIMEIFEYIHCFGRDQFEEKLAQFDLTQSFPRLSLIDKKDQLISQIFVDSERENLIVKQL